MFTRRRSKDSLCTVFLKRLHLTTCFSSFRKRLRFRKSFRILNNPEAILFIYVNSSAVGGGDSRTAAPDWTRFTIKKRPSDKPDFSVQLGPIWSYRKTCKERDNVYACCFIIVYFVSRRNSDCSDTQTRFSLKVKVRNRVTATRRAKKTYTKEESAPSSTATAGQQLRIG